MIADHDFFVKGILRFRRKLPLFPQKNVRDLSVPGKIFGDQIVQTFRGKIGKAGRTRYMGVRPTVRGVTMNPCDHPHGGGEGKTGPGGHPKTPWGKPALGYKTRKQGKASDKLIVRRRKTK